MNITRRRALETAVGLAAVSMCATACSSPERRGDGLDARLEPWDGQLQELFDDQIHPAAVGLSMDSQSPARDPLLRLRTTNADVVSRMQIKTVTRESVGARTVFLLGLMVVPPAFARPKLNDSRFELAIKQESGAFGLVQSLENALREKQFIGFVRKFPGEDGPVIHWHLTADTEEVAQVVQEVAVLDEIGGSEK